MDGQKLEFGTTGLLRFSNLVMYDRQTESWWQEFTGEAVVGELTGKKLELLPMNIVSWEEFKVSFPDGKVLSKDTGYSLPYGRTPYSSYDSSRIPWKGLPLMERVVAIDLNGESLAVPFSALEKESIISYTLAGQDLVIFFKLGTVSALDNEVIAEGRDVGAAGVFDPALEGRELTFILEDGEIVDEQTGSTWSLLGKATTGPLEGKRLMPIPHSGAQFWFSLVAFKPGTIIYQGK